MYEINKIHKIDKINKMDKMDKRDRRDENLAQLGEEINKMGQIYSNIRCKMNYLMEQKREDELEKRIEEICENKLDRLLGKWVSNTEDMSRDNNQSEEDSKSKEDNIDIFSQVFKDISQNNYSYLIDIMIDKGFKIETLLAQIQPFGKNNPLYQQLLERINEEDSREPRRPNRLLTKELIRSKYKMDDNSKRRSKSHSKETTNSVENKLYSMPNPNHDQILDSKLWYQDNDHNRNYSKQSHHINQLKQNFSYIDSPYPNIKITNKKSDNQDDTIKSHQRHSITIKKSNSSRHSPCEIPRTRMMNNRNLKPMSHTNILLKNDHTKLFDVRPLDMISNSHSPKKYHRQSKIKGQQPYTFEMNENIDPIDESLMMYVSSEMNKTDQSDELYLDIDQKNNKHKPLKLSQHKNNHSENLGSHSNHLDYHQPLRDDKISYNHIYHNHQPNKHTDQLNKNNIIQDLDEKNIKTPKIDFQNLIKEPIEYPLDKESLDKQSLDKESLDKEPFDKKDVDKEYKEDKEDVDKEDVDV